MRKGLLLTFAAVALMTAQPAQAQLGKLKGLAGKAKEKVKQTVKDKVGNIGESTGSVAGEVLNVARGTAPWPMSGGDYNGKDVRKFIYEITDVSDAELIALRDQNLARYKTDANIMNNGGNYGGTENQEIQNYLRFLFELQTLVSINVNNVSISSDGTFDISEAYYLITCREGAGIGYFVTKKDGRFVFVTKKGDGVYLSTEDVATAQQAAQRMRKLQLFTSGLRDVMKTDKQNYNGKLAALSDICGHYADAVEEACKTNTPENIERKPRPANGAMHASMKAQALAVAKADDPEVVDVIITSAQWDVKMKGAIPVNRNIYGYYIYKDENGLQCYSRMWTEDYKGNGKYGSLRKGGVGVESPFYIK